MRTYEAIITNMYNINEWWQVEIEAGSFDLAEAEAKQWAGERELSVLIGIGVKIEDKEGGDDNAR